jgi:hypothetical protein
MGLAAHMPQAVVAAEIADAHTICGLEAYNWAS